MEMEKGNGINVSDDKKGSAENDARAADKTVSSKTTEGPSDRTKHYRQTLCMLHHEAI